MAFDIMPYLAEGIGTFALVFFGAGAAAMQAPDSQTAMIIVGLVFALILLAIIFIWGKLSGANVNPVVSIVLAFDGRISYAKMAGYILAQFIGCIVAGALLLYVFGSDSNLGSTIGVLTDTDPWKAVVIEIITTFVFVLTILVVTADVGYAAIGGVVIALTLGLGVTFGYNLTGGSLNPFRSFGPALFSGNLNTIWIYFLGPFLGGILAFLIYLMFKKALVSQECYGKIKCA